MCDLHGLLQINFGAGQSFDYFPLYGINERFEFEVILKRRKERILLVKIVLSPWFNALIKNF